MCRLACWQHRPKYLHEPSRLKFELINITILDSSSNVHWKNAWCVSDTVACYDTPTPSSRTRLNNCPLAGTGLGFAHLPICTFSEVLFHILIYCILMSPLYHPKPSHGEMLLCPVPVVYFSLSKNKGIWSPEKKKSCDAFKQFVFVFVSLFCRRLWLVPDSCPA